MNAVNTESGLVLTEIRSLIAQSRQQIASTVNASMSMLYWQIGTRINNEVIQNQRAEYGAQIIHSLSRELVVEYGGSFSEKNLRRMMQFASLFPEKEIVVSLIRQLSWTHILAVIPIEDPLKRAFYIEMCKHEKWSVRVFRERINSMLYERTTISKKPEETIHNDLKNLNNTGQISPDLVFRDPYFLDFLGLKDTYSEKDLESSIISEIQRFMTELGSDFAYLSRQKRLTIDHRDYYIDLLFYHRRLKCLIAIDLKIGEFDAAHKGEMELYLAYLEKYETIEGENPPIGLILCSGKNPEHIELMQLHKSNIKIADYFTILPSKELLLNKLNQAIKNAKNNLKT